MGNDGTTFENKSVNTQYILANNPSTQGNTWASTFDWDNNYACAFEIVSVDGDCWYMDSTGTIKYATLGKYSFDIASTTPIQQGFRVSVGASLKFKNFVIYPI